MSRRLLHLVRTEQGKLLCAPDPKDAILFARGDHWYDPSGAEVPLPQLAALVFEYDAVAVW